MKQAGGWDCDSLLLSDVPRLTPALHQTHGAHLVSPISCNALQPPALGDLLVSLFCYLVCCSIYCLQLLRIKNESCSQGHGTNVSSQGIQKRKNGGAAAKLSEPFHASFFLGPSWLLTYLFPCFATYLCCREHLAKQFTQCCGC